MNSPRRRALSARRSREPSPRLDLVREPRRERSPRREWSPRARSPASPLSDGPTLLRPSPPLRRARSRSVQRSAPQAAQPASGFGLRKWWHGREMRETRAMARALLLALTAAAVGVSLVLNLLARIEWRPPPPAADGGAGGGGGRLGDLDPAEQRRAVACPRGSELEADGRCVASTAECPDGSAWQGGRCVAHPSLGASWAARLACTGLGAGVVYALALSLALVAARCCWRLRPRPRRFRCLQDAAMTAERDFLPSGFGDPAAALQTVGHISQGDVVTVRRLDTSRPTRQRRAQLANGYWVSLVSQRGERLFQELPEAEPPDGADGPGLAPHAGGVSMFDTFGEGQCQVRLDGEHRLAARRATFGARLGATTLVCPAFCTG